MGIKIFNCFGLIGSDERDLSAVSKDSLDDNRHKAFVVNGAAPLLFEWSAASVEPTNTMRHPFVVRPNDFDSAGTWIEKKQPRFTAPMTRQIPPASPTAHSITYTNNKRITP